MLLDSQEITAYTQAISKAVFEMKTKLVELQTYREDYEALIRVLIELPLKTKCPIMVPFGSLAYMPGQIVHTNEVTVQLGDGWFVERTATQAKEMIHRRIQELNTSIETVSSQLNTMEERQTLSSSLFSTSKDPNAPSQTVLNEEGLPMLDICEPFNGEEALDNSMETLSNLTLSKPALSIQLVDSTQKFQLSKEDESYLNSIFDQFDLDEENEDEDEDFQPTSSNHHVSSNEKKATPLSSTDFLKKKLGLINPSNPNRSPTNHQPIPTLPSISSNIPSTSSPSPSPSSSPSSPSSLPLSTSFISSSASKISLPIKKKKVTFSEEVSISDDSNDIDHLSSSFIDTQHEFSSSKKGKGSISSKASPVSFQVIERDTSKEDQECIQENIAHRIEHNQLLHAYHQKLLSLLKRLPNESDETITPAFGQPFLPTNVDEKLKLQYDLSNSSSTLKN